MTEASRHDAWQAGDSYDLYMGRWSRQIAPKFLEWLDIPDDQDWLDVGCGTGALSGAIVANCNPTSVLGVDPSEGFLDKARTNVPDRRAAFQTGDAQALPLDAASRDVVVSGLVLNFVSDREKALGEMRRVARPGGTIAFYVWDYPGGGVKFMRAFWTAATSLDPAAADLTEDKRFPFCTPERLLDLVKGPDFVNQHVTTLEASAVFRDFDDFWRPFTLGAGPAPGYCVGLSPDAQLKLRNKLFDTLPRAADGSIPLGTRAWAIRAEVR